MVSVPEHPCPPLHAPERDGWECGRQEATSGRDQDNPGKKPVFIFNRDAENVIMPFKLSQDIQSRDTESQVVSDFMYFR